MEQAFRRALRATAALVALASSAALAGPPSIERAPLQNEFDRCALSAEEHGNRSLSGRIRMELLIRKTGNVYASFIWGENGIDDRKLEGCLTSVAPIWMFPAVPLDYQRAYSPTFIHSGDSGIARSAGWAGQGRATVMLPDINDLPEPTPLNEKVAQQTLDVADWATNAERANAEAAVHLYAPAIDHARQALQQDPNDPIALRALAQALAESGGDLLEARRAAERLVGIDPRSEQGHEALLRVCLAAKDDGCTFEEWNKARKAPDLQPRSRLLAALQGPTQLAVERLKALTSRASATGKPAEAGQPPQPADPCAAEKGEVAQALCVVKRCLDEGSLDYAKELSSQNGLRYTARDWRAKSVAPGKLLVTRPIEPAPPKAGEPQSQAARHDALWLVNLGDQYVMRPTNTEARQITVRHNRCTARVVTGH